MAIVQTQAAPCVSYERMNPWLVAKVQPNNEVEILGSKDDTEIIYPILTQLYGQDVTDWIANILPVLLQAKVDQSGSVRNIGIKMKQMDDGMRLWITVSPKQ
jgi:hypothetical protein